MSDLKIPKNVIAHEGLLFRMLGTQEADELARSCGFVYAEQLVREMGAKQAQSMKFQVQELRPEVLAFALLMEKRLREKDADKGTSWKLMSGQDLMVHANWKTRAMENTVRFQSPNTALHAVDLANYCMMVADVTGALQQPKVIDQPDEWRCA